MGLTVAFARDLAKHAPLGLYNLMRVTATGDGASLQLANAWAGSSHHPLSLMKMRQTIEREMLWPRDLALPCTCPKPSIYSLGHGATLFVPSTFCNLRSHP